jgi:dihydroceramidase
MLIAEFWNTLSNVCIVIPALIGLITAYNKGMETRFILSYAGVVGLGIGSWIFHMTLVWEGQLLDELPMVYSACFLIFNTLDYKYTDSSYRNRIVGFLAMYAFLVTVIYVNLKVAAFHQGAYFLMIVAIIYLSYERATQESYRQAKSLFRYSVLSIAVAYALWNVDVHFCGKLQRLRAWAGPFAPLFQLHAWWHLGTGVSSYLQLVFAAGCRVAHTGHEPEIIYPWYTLGLPLLVNEMKGLPRHSTKTEL